MLYRVPRSNSENTPPAMMHLRSSDSPEHAPKQAPEEAPHSSSAMTGLVCELRSSAAGIIGFIGLIRDEVPEDYSDLCALVEEQTLRLVATAEAMVTLAERKNR